MGKRRQISEEVVREVAASFGARIVQIGKTGGNHCFALIELGAKRRKVFYPSTPSDSARGHLNLRCEIKKALGALL
jgi:hypothetical protein